MHHLFIAKAHSTGRQAFFQSVYASKCSSLDMHQHSFNRSISYIDCVIQAGSVHCQRLNCLISLTLMQSTLTLSEVRILHKDIEKNSG